MDNLNDLEYDVSEENNKFIIEIELPGIEKEELDIDYENGYIIVSIISDNTKSKTSKRKKYYGKSIKHYVGEVIDSEIEASLKNGILTITIPKQEKKNKKKIVIN